MLNLIPKTSFFTWKTDSKITTKRQTMTSILTGGNDT